MAAQMTRLAMRKNVSISPQREKYSGWNPQIKKQPSIAARTQPRIRFHRIHPFCGGKTGKFSRLQPK